MKGKGQILRIGLCAGLMIAAWGIGEVFLPSDAVSPQALSSSLKDYELPYRRPESVEQMRPEGSADTGIQGVIAYFMWQLQDSTAMRQRVTLFDFATRGSMAARKLADIGAAARHHLLYALYDQHSTARGNAALALGYMKEYSAMEALIGLLKDEQPGVRTKAVMAIGEIGSASGGKALVNALEDEDSGVRVEAVRALANMDGRYVVDSLMRSLVDESCLVRWESIIVLGDRGADEYAVTQLINALTYGEGTVRNGAAHALARMKNIKALDALVAAWIRNAEVMVTGIEHIN